MITLWGRLSSANVQKVVFALAELGIDYEHVPLGGRFGGTGTAKYLAMNPNGKVPTLRDGDLVLWESHAIVRYLGARYGAGSLWPIDPADRAVTDQWADWTATTFQPAWIDAFWAIVRTPPERQEDDTIARSVAATERCFAIMETRLEKAPWLGGERMTYADIVAAAAMFRWTTMRVGKALPRAVAAWHGRLRERKAFREAVEVDYEELRGRVDF